MPLNVFFTGIVRFTLLALFLAGAGDTDFQCNSHPRCGSSGTTCCIHNGDVAQGSIQSGFIYAVRVSQTTKMHAVQCVLMIKCRVRISEKSYPTLSSEARIQLDPATTYLQFQILSFDSCAGFQFKPVAASGCET